MNEFRMLNSLQYDINPFLETKITADCHTYQRCFFKLNIVFDLGLMIDQTAAIFSKKSVVEISILQTCVVLVIKETYSNTVIGFRRGMAFFKQQDY